MYVKVCVYLYVYGECVCESVYVCERACVSVYICVSMRACVHYSSIHAC